MNRVDSIETHNHQNCPSPGCIPVRPKPDDQTERRAAELLAQHPQFRGRSSLIRICCKNGRLVLSGQLPSYYLKQLAQEAVRNAGNLEIENNIRVFGLPEPKMSSAQSRPEMAADTAPRILPR